MRLIVGLGNPDEKYKCTRHNVGHTFIDTLIHKSESVHTDQKSFAEVSHIVLFDQKILLAKLTVYMNESGGGVRKIMEKYGIQYASRVCVVHDDLDLSLGMYKIQKGKGPKVHNGITSVEEAIGKDFWRIRIGIDRRNEYDRVSPQNYVLQKWSAQEETDIHECIENIYEDIRFKNILLGK